MLLDVAAKKQVESSASRRREARAPPQERSSHRRSPHPSGQLGCAKSVHSPTGRRVNSNHGTRDTSSVRGMMMTKGGSDGEHRPGREYSRRRGARYDSIKDRSRSPTPDPLGLQDFSVNVLAAAPPARYRVPTTVANYDGETHPSVWLEDYRLACHNGGATRDLFIIKSIPLYLADLACTWLEHLPRGRINSWAQLREPS
jgi:hypothetical protein